MSTRSPRHMILLAILLFLACAACHGTGCH